MIGSLSHAPDGMDSNTVARSTHKFSASPPPMGQLSDQEIIQKKMPLLLGLLLGSSVTSNSPSDPEPAIRGGVVCQDADRWETDFWTGQEFPAAHSLASDAIDRGEVVVQDQFSAVEVPTINISDPLLGSQEHATGATATPSTGSSPQGPAGGLSSQVMPGIPNLAVLLSINGKPAPAVLLRTLATALGGFLSLHRDRQTHTRRLWQTTTMLQGAAAWQQLDDDQALLASVAQCACEVLSCERATIFLWDKPRRRLIGRPAIGVEGGVLEVEDNAGIVGEVLQSGSPRWWSAGGNDGGRVNRRIDRVQNFQTHSLAAVPMVNSRGQIVGVFEGINARRGDHRGGAFDAADIHTLSELALHAVVAIDSQRTRANLTRTRDRLVSQAAASNPLIGEHHSIRELRKNATKVAPTDLSVLILGQNGTGKEVLAQQIHYQSDRRNGPFIAVNCAALVESLLESELFGHEKGAFTDASTSRPGKFELAHGGTLFLDEIGDMSAGGQAKLLRVLEERVVVRVGGTQPIPVDTRVIAATNQPLQELIASQRFREDLFFRLNVVSLTLPPLAERGDDVMILADHFIAHFCSKIGRVVPKFDDSARHALLSHRWPGNVRELRNTIERVCYLTSGERVRAEDLMLPTLHSNDGAGAGPGTVSHHINLNDATRDFQIAHIERAIAACGGNMTEAAGKLGLHRSNLYRKMRQLGMSTSE